MLSVDKIQQKSTLICALIFFTYFYMWKGGILMRDYIINENLLCFTQDTNDKNKILVVEKSKNVTFNGNSLSFLKKCCFCYGHSYNIQRQFVIDHFNYYIKTPIIVSSYNMIIFFPTCTPSSKKCIWLAYNNITRYVKESNGTKIYFDNGKEMNIKVPYTTIDNQITKCIKIEKYLNGIMRKTVEK